MRRRGVVDEERKLQDKRGCMCIMKYEIEVMVATITEENMADLKEILFGDPYDVISVVEGGELMDEEKEAFEEFKKQSATARRQGNGTIEIRIPQLIRGEAELDEDTLDEFGDEIYLISEYEVIDQGEFDEESLHLFRELGYTI
ncbi:MAG: hypothetical protein IJ801_02240 [Lachnospiraceae bacterium]|nr:hypothetical protein [Lachnospiraceae bacterium]